MAFSSIRSPRAARGLGGCWVAPRSLPAQRISLACKDYAASSSVIDTKLQSLNRKAYAARLQHLEEQASSALLAAANNFERPVFPCALIAGDVVMLYLLHKLDLLKTVKVVFVDTFHLFPETLDFLKQVEAAYNFEALVYSAKEFADVAAYKAVHGSDLPIRDIDEYDRICKVEPFQRSLAEQRADVMINGRRRDHGSERSHLSMFDVTPTGLSNCQPLAYWEFEDVFAFAESNGVKLHPLHEQGYPSVGDIHSTLPVAREKWFEYGGERSGRFQGLTNADGSDKTECGIHNVGSVLEPAASSLTPPK